ncbi:MAG TPA: isoprenylcysteine carboxylmethyltransferase family protein [Pyrinomonadaceae bacterium]|nr:isoprenylcysteine carboxylmethyltransferase family protein [Pyrinomonadaceae bacterium]
MQVWRVTLLLLLLSCFCSFAWALRAHFVASRMSIFMRLIAVLGAVLTFLQLMAMLAAPSFGPIRSLMGVWLYTASLAGFWWTVSATRSRRLSVAFSVDRPDFLLESGPYRFVRHPFYAAYSLFWIAGLVVAPRWYLLPGVAVMLSSYFSAARMEEAKFASSGLQDVYQGYRARTGMFLPRLRGRHQGAWRTVDFQSKEGGL